MNRKGSLIAGTALGVMLAMGLAVVLPGMGLQRASAEDQALADTFFKVDWAVSPGKDGQSKISGFVYNNYGSEADQVELLITALDASGHPIRTSIERIGDVPALDRVSFELQVPKARAQAGAIPHQHLGPFSRRIDEQVAAPGERILAVSGGG